MIDIIHALILGIVEGISEFLPISSTGHLILTSRLLGMAQTDFLVSFEIAIQLGAILAVVCLYGKTIVCNVEIIKRVMAAFIPTAVIGFLLYKVIKQYFFANHQIVLWSLFLGGIFLIVFELIHKNKIETAEELATIPLKKALIIGLCQSLAVIPGVSRAAATIVGGLALGLRRQVIVEFSFLLAVPTMLAATGLDILKNAQAITADQFSFLAVGFISSFLVAIVSIRGLLFFIKHHNFIPFGIYRIAVALLFWILIQ